MSNVKPSMLDLDLVSGFCMSDKAKLTQHRVSDMIAQFANEAMARAMVREGDPLLYEFYGPDLPEDDSGVLQFGTTILYPGKVGEEYFMTKGHFHTILDTPGIYYGLSGHGTMLMETPEDRVDWKEIGPGEALYVPGRWARRSTNISIEPLVMFSVYRRDAGHDYGTIEEKGYRKLVVKQDGRPTVIDSPKWKV